MIQRIQSLYFLLIAGLMLAMSIMPLATFQGDVLITAEMSGFYSADLKETLTPFWPIYLCLVVAIEAFVALFSYKNRSLQITLGWSLLFSILSVYAVFFFYAWPFFRDYNYTIGFALAFPAIALILDLLAIRAIKKDDNLVKSLDRIR